jgi:rRNA maturation protein Nop10
VALARRKDQRLRAVPLGGPSSLDKAKGIVTAYPGIWRGMVLDAGCRDQALRLALEEHPVRYVGLDIHPPADVLADLGDGIPLADAEADVVVALDVLEHTDAIHYAFDELCRVARRHVVIALPNQFALHDRWETLRGRQRSGKYGLPLDPPRDRHRWLFGFDEARTFCRHRALAAGWRVVDEAVMVGPRRRNIQPLVCIWPSLLAPDLVAHLTPVSARS